MPRQKIYPCRSCVAGVFFSKEGWRCPLPVWERNSSERCLFMRYTPLFCFRNKVYKVAFPCDLYLLLSCFVWKRLSVRALCISRKSGDAAVLFRARSCRRKEESYDRYESPGRPPVVKSRFLRIEEAVEWGAVSDFSCRYGAAAGQNHTLRRLSDSKFPADRKARNRCE